MPPVADVVPSSSQASSVWIDPARTDYLDVRCHACKRLIAKMTPDALRPGGILQVKCRSCDAVNYRVGIDTRNLEA